MMFWLLIAVFFAADGTKTVQTKVEPSQIACMADAQTLSVAIQQDPPKELVGVGLKCDGPLPDPTIPKTDASAKP